MSVHRPNVTKTKADRGVTSVTTGQRRPSPSDWVCSRVSRRQALAARPAGKAPQAAPLTQHPPRGWRQSGHGGRSGRAAAQPGGLPAQPRPGGDGRLPLSLRTHPRHLLAEGQNRISSPKRNVRWRPLCTAALECRRAGDGGFYNADGQTVPWVAAL